MWTFGRKIALGFALSFLVLVVIGAVSYRSTDVLTSTGEAVEHTHVVLTRLERLLSIIKDAETGQRGFALTGDAAFLEDYEGKAAESEGNLRDLRQLTADNPRQQQRLTELEPLVAEKMGELAETVGLRREQGFEAAQKLVAEKRGKRTMDRVRAIVTDMKGEEESLLGVRQIEADGAASSSRMVILLGTLIGLVLVTAAGFLITRSLNGQIGSAVSHIQASTAELSAAASQQATGAKEQATALNEIRVTITELLGTSRQIAGSAQRVSQIANETAAGAASGEGIVDVAQDAVGTIKRDVDLLVGHMLELGRKSQRIGAIVDIISELAEQTNILAINAAIEAVGGGELSRRFGVVAEEIRKLADRVGGSTKEIRGLADDIRGAVNTTVMVTEGGSKSVEAGARQFTEVTAAFKRIANLVKTTTEAAREIELSTKQQATAVEQVNMAVANTSSAAQETEVSATQTLQTSSQLTTLARNLARIIKPSVANTPIG